MLQIDVFFTPFEFDFQAKKDSTVVIGVDILRAGTTICKALNSGAKEVIPVGTTETALKIYNKFDKGLALLCGERNSKKIDSYHLGNSPFEYEPEVVSGKVLIFNTSNGSSLFEKLLNYPFFFVGGFVNFSILMHQVIEIIRNQGVGYIVLICAGQDNKFTFEDVLFCGLFVSDLMSRYEDLKEVGLNDAALASLELYRIHQGNLLEFVKTTNHCKQLISLGFEKDVELAFSSDAIPILPISNGLSIVFKF